jgi:hypothetical protein
MNATTEPVILELEEVPRRESAPANLPAVADASPASMMLAALQRGASLESVEKMMALQERWEAGEARKAYNAAFSEFKAEAVHIVKNKQVTDGPLRGKSYAELHAVVDALTPALSRHGLSASWKLTKDDRDWMEVTCYLRHVKGHEESVSMGGPPDAGGAKNAIQARASTKSYLERYTLKAICGVAEGGEDDDGNGGKEPTEIPAELLQAARDESLKGWNALAAWIKLRTPQERKLLEPESANLKAAAKAADAKGAK